MNTTHPYRPQTNGTTERFHRTLADGRAHTRKYTCEATRRETLAGWIHFYNHDKPHSACDNKPPITHLTNTPSQNK